MKKIRAGMLTLIIASTLCMAFIAPALAEEESTIYLHHDYTFTHDIYESIVVCADDIVIDGNGYRLQCPGFGWYGFYLFGRTGVTIKNVGIEGWFYGIYLTWHSDDNTLSGNAISYNMVGIYLENDCDGNTLSGNTVSNNDFGIDVWANCDDNTLIDNTISNNWIGIELSFWSIHNLIYHNNFLGNPTQAYDTNAWANDWHHPDLLEGNYWSDYPGVDDGSGTGKHAIAGDGIGDTDIPWTCGDDYPLMFMWIIDPAHAPELYMRRRGAHGGGAWPEWHVGLACWNQTLYVRIMNYGEMGAYVEVKFEVSAAGLTTQEYVSDQAWIDAATWVEDDIVPGEVVVSATFHVDAPGVFDIGAKLYCKFWGVTEKVFYGELEPVLGGEAVSRDIATKYKVVTHL